MRPVDLAAPPTRRVRPDVRSTRRKRLPAGSHVGLDGARLAPRVRGTRGAAEAPAWEGVGGPRFVWITRA